MYVYIELLIDESGGSGGSKGSGDSNDDGVWWLRYVDESGGDSHGNVVVVELIVVTQWWTWR